MAHPTRVAHDGLELPRSALAPIAKGLDVLAVVGHALEQGYRLIDSVYNYEN